MEAETLTIVYNGEQSELILPGGLGSIFPGVPRPVPAALANALSARGDITIVTAESVGKQE